jgi:hypothetical protein
LFEDFAKGSGQSCLEDPPNRVAISRTWHWPSAVGGKQANIATAVNLTRASVTQPTTRPDIGEKLSRKAHPQWMGLPCPGLEVEGRDDRSVVGLGIFSVDSEGCGLVVQDLVVDF